MKQRILDPKLSVGSLLVVGLLLINAVFTYCNIRKLHTDTGWVIHTHKVIESINEITSLITVAGARQRGYIITGDPHYLEPYNTVFSAVDKQFKLLENLIQDNPEQLSHASHFKRIVNNRLKTLNEDILLMQQKGWNAARRRISNSLGNMSTDKLRDQAQRMIDAENRLLELRSRRYEDVYHVTLFTIFLTNFISFVMMVAFLHVLRLHLMTRTQEELILFKEREFFHVTINSIGDAVVTTDTEGRITSLNTVAQSLTGWTQEEAVGQPMDQVFHLIHEHTRQPVEDPVSRVLKEGIITRLAIQTILIAKDGTEISIEDSAAPIRDRNKDIIGAVLIFRDITENKKIDKDRKRLAAIVDFSDDAIIGKDLHGIITNWNYAAQRLFGYTPQEAIGKSVLMLIPEGRRKEETEILSRIQQGESVDSYKTIRQRKDGSLVNISLTVSPIKDRYNTVIGASKIARDITKQQKLEEDLSRSNQELEQFAYVASHDLKEPLHTISSFADLLTRQSAAKLGEKEKEYVDAIKQAALQGKTLVKELLEFSRIGKAQDFQMIDLLEIVQKVQTSLSTLIEDSNAHIVCDGPLPQIRGNAVEMGQLFQNLIENSIKYRSPESPQIHISAAPAENNKWLVSVQDNGMGIDAEYKERIFGIFERLHSKSEYSGTGIGLAICKKIVEHYQGAIWVESEPGKGSVFYFTLPKA